MAAQPNYVVSPGDHIREWLYDNSLNAAELARRLNVTPKHISEVLAGKAPLSATIAIGLERVTGIPARIWNQFEAGYREDIARLAETNSLAAQYERAKNFPLGYLRKWKFITAPASDRVSTVRQVLELFRIAHLDAYEAAWGQPKVAYRKSRVAVGKQYDLATWLAIGERLAASENLPDFSRAGVEEIIPKLRALTKADPLHALEEATCLLADCGAALVLVPPIPGLGIFGATRWVNGHPIIQLSLHGKSDDQLWFTLFHELGHILLHGSNFLYILGEDSETEREADEFASNTLIPPAAAASLPITRDLSAITKIANELGVAPSIVLGRAQRESKDFAWGHNLKRKLDFQATKNITSTN